MLMNCYQSLKGMGKFRDDAGKVKGVHKEFEVGNLVKIKTKNRYFKQPLGIIFGFTGNGALKVRWSNGTSDIHSGIGLIKVAE